MSSNENLIVEQLINQMKSLGFLALKNVPDFDEVEL